ncbi:hypothetical protein F1542_03455 [Komagataeibacter sp. FXV3]|nr:hypothetical protein [Komagataeibacter sp. FXV3]
MKLFAKASKERRLFEKRRHPKTFIFLSMSCFQTVSKGPAMTRQCRWSGQPVLFGCLYAVFSVIRNIVRIVAPADPDFSINS